MQNSRFLRSPLWLKGTGALLWLIVSHLLLISQNPAPEKPIDKAYQLSWQGDYQQAQLAFLDILALDPERPDALSGLAYAYAWAGHYDQSETVFLKLEKSQPGSFEAEKGLAYLALWNRKAKEAIRRFKALTLQHENQADLWMGMGLAYLLDLQQQKARLAFQKADKLAPGKTDAGVFLQQLQSSPAWMEVHLWGGFSQVNTQNQWGLRAGQLLFHPHRNLQVWGRYDNSLSLDNADFLRRNLTSPLWLTGGLYNWNPQLTTRIEMGYRALPDVGRQYFVQGEQVVFLGAQTALKTGALYAPRSDGKTEWFSYLSGFVPLSSTLALEPTYYIAQNVDGLWGHRWQLDANFRQDPKGYRLQGGVLYGWSPQLSTAEQLVSSWGLNFQAQAVMGQQHWLLFLLRYESSPLQNFFTASLGVRFRIEK